jgi:hypothetical protein
VVEAFLWILECRCCKSYCFNSEKRPSWSWSYGSWTYNYLCNQCLLWVRISLMASCTRYYIMW